MIKAQISGRMVSSDVAFASVKTRLKKLMVMIIGERAKRARHSLVCSIENRGYIYYILLYIIDSTCNFVLITRKEGGA